MATCSFEATIFSQQFPQLIKIPRVLIAAHFRLFGDNGLEVCAAPVQCNTFGQDYRAALVEIAEA